MENRLLVVFHILLINEICLSTLSKLSSRCKVLSLEAWQINVRKQ